MIRAPRELLLLLLAGALAGGEVGSASAVLAANTDNPGNSIATGTSAWFALNASGTALCAGVDGTLTCPFGNRPGAGTTVATAAVAVKAASTFQLAVVNGSGPAGIATIVTASFRSTGTATAVLAAGAADTIDLTLKIKGGTPAGAYAGTITLTDLLTGATASFPISLTH